MDWKWPRLFWSWIVGRRSVGPCSIGSSMIGAAVRILVVVRSIGVGIVICSSFGPSTSTWAIMISLAVFWHACLFLSFFLSSRVLSAPSLQKQNGANADWRQMPASLVPWDRDSRTYMHIHAHTCARVAMCWVSSVIGWNWMSLVSLVLFLNVGCSVNLFSWARIKLLFRYYDDIEWKISKNKAAKGSKAQRLVKSSKVSSCSQTLYSQISGMFRFFELENGPKETSDATSTY